uniref:SLOG family protein n=1 Tax=Candidatus Fimivicinus sp. TaxID=3056640 RepID=UPI003FEF540E
MTNYSVSSKGGICIQNLSCCFTGHRKIPKDDLPKLQKRLRKAVKGLLKQGVTIFYTGGALGFDTLAAQAVLNARRYHPQVKLILALPCRNQAERWKEADRLLYESIKQRADEVVYV